MKGLLIAVQFLTRLPTLRVSVTTAEFAASMRWFPAVGLIVGALVTGALCLGALIDGWVAAFAALVVWIGVTGALHLDGLGDCIDASGAAHKVQGNDRSVLTAILADPHLGSFGAVAIVLQLIGKLVLLHFVAVEGGVSLLGGLVLIPFAARIGPLVWTRWLEPLHDGLGARFRNSVRRADLAVWGAVLVGLAWFFPAVLATPVLVAGWGWWVWRKLGGISGDSHGAGIELVELGLLLCFAIAARIAS